MMFEDIKRILRDKILMLKDGNPEIAKRLKAALEQVTDAQRIAEGR